MQALADRVGLSKATLYGYFRTKEEVLAIVLAELFADWFDQLERELERRAKWTAGDITRVTVSSLRGREALVRLLLTLESILENNLELAFVRGYKTELLRRLTRLGGLLEARWRGLSPGQGVPALMHIRALIMGLRQMADASPIAREALDVPHLAPLRIDFERELTTALGALLRGYEHQAKPRRGL